MIRLIGHRGTVGTEPENTLRSFRRAVADGADELELDVRCSADGHLVVVHDATVDRTTDGTGPVAEHTLDALRRLDAGHGERVPTYLEVLAAVAVPIQTEVKELAAVGPLATLLADPALAGRVTLASHHLDILAALAEAMPSVPRALIVPRPGPDLVALALSVKAEWVAPGLATLTEELMAECRAAGLSVDTWPAPDPATLGRAIALGADAVTTDYPGVLRAWLNRQAG